MLKIMRFSTVLSEVQMPFGLFIPADGTDLALRVYCRYVPPQIPPPPQIVVVVAIQNPPLTFEGVDEKTGEPMPKQVLRNFMLWPLETDLPANFIKYVATIPFGADKTNYDIIEVGT